MKTLFLISLVCLAGCRTQQTEPPTTQQPDYAAIAAAAERASHQYRMQQSQDQKAYNLIPKKFWGEAIVQLNPIRVESDAVNVAIVLWETDTYEAGYYFSSNLSSLLRINSQDMIFEHIASYDDSVMGGLSYYKKYKKTAIDILYGNSANPNKTPFNH